MPFTQLYFLVEGDDDDRLLQNVVVPALATRYDLIRVWKYAQEKTEKTEAFLNSIKSVGAEYFFLADVDAFPCFPEKREALLQRFKRLDRRQIVIVVKEMESWYVAGLPAKNRLKIKVPADTSPITKEHFYSAMPGQFDSRVDYMVEVLKLFHLEAAARRNASFRYFATRCGLLPPGS